jgi:DNA-binding NarL/FixJ family response regulator
MDTLLLVEDDVPTQTWLRGLLLDGGTVGQVQVCSNVRDALAWLAAHRPDIALIDLGLPDGSGLEVIRQVVALHPSCEVLVLSIFGDERNVLSAIDAGAGGYLLKDGSIENIRSHLACLREGGSPLSPSIARTLINRHRKAVGQAGKAQALPSDASIPAQPPLVAQSNAHGKGPGRAPACEAANHSPGLSDREIEVLTGVAKGFSYAEVGQMLGMSTNTVRTHIRRLYEKLSVNSRSEALMEFNRRRSEQGLPPIC